jgi:hypothetical protein
MDFSWTAIDPLVILDAKGDLITATAADTPARLAVGTNGQTLVADSTASTGLKWATPSSGGMTLINTGGTTLSGASVTVSSIPSTYTNLLIVLSNYYTSTTDELTQIRFNGDSGTNYTYSRIRNIGTTVTGASSLSATSAEINVRSTDANTSGKTANAEVQVFRYADTTPNKFYSYTASAVESTNNVCSVTGTGNYKGTSAISSVTIVAGINFSGGTVYVYGVN